MFVCQYCGALHAAFKSHFSSCGAALAPQSKMKNSPGPSGSFEERLQLTCAAYEDAREFLPGSVLSKKKLRAAEKNFTIFSKDKRKGRQ